MRSALSVRSYSAIIFGFCLLFLIFGYRSMRSAPNKRDDYAGKKIERLAKLKKTCSDLSQIGGHSICSIQMLNKVPNCLVFSVAMRTDLKFEMGVAERLDKCKVRVYDHEAKATNSDGEYRVIEKMDTEFIDEKALKKIVDSEKGKIHVLRLEAGDKGTQLAQSKLLKERSVCQLLLTLYNINRSELDNFLKAMEKDHGYKLYSLKELSGEKEEEDDADEGEEEWKEDKEGEEGEVNNNSPAGRTRHGDRPASRHYALSFIAQNCLKNFGIKEQ